MKNSTPFTTTLKAIERDPVYCARAVYAQLQGFDSWGVEDWPFLVWILALVSSKQVTLGVDLIPTFDRDANIADGPSGFMLTRQATEAILRKEIV